MTEVLSPFYGCTRQACFGHILKHLAEYSEIKSSMGEGSILYYRETGYCYGKNNKKPSNYTAAGPVADISAGNSKSIVMKTVPQNKQQDSSRADIEIYGALS